VFVFIAVIPVAFACDHSPCATERVASRSVYLSGPCDPMWKYPTLPAMTSPTSPLREHNREKGTRKSEAENGVELKISTPTITTLLFLPTVPSNLCLNTRLPSMVFENRFDFVLHALAFVLGPEGCAWDLSD
jgi:hypothetical protein